VLLAIPDRRTDIGNSYEGDMQNGRSGADIGRSHLSALGIDRATERALAGLRPAIDRELPAILDRLYDGVVSAAVRQAQTGYWRAFASGAGPLACEQAATALAEALAAAGLGADRMAGDCSRIAAELARCHPDIRRRSWLRRNAGVDAAELAGSLMPCVLLAADAATAFRQRQAGNEQRAVIHSMAGQIDEEIQASVADVTGLTMALRESAGRLNGIAEQTARDSDTTAEAARQALAGAETVASAAEELHASIAEIARRIGESQQVAHRAADMAVGTRDIVASLARSAQEIGRVVDIISAIAGQTNLLALNATIEAARAGEAGKGFAIVASEVKGLASQAARSADDIARQVEDIRQVSEQAAAAIDQVGGAIHDMETASTGIAAAIEEQSAATREIARSVHDTALISESVTGRMVKLARQAGEAGILADEVMADTDRMSDNMASLRRALVRIVRTASPEADRRADPRIACHLAAEIEAGAGGGGNGGTGTIVNLSTGGAMIHADPPLTPGQPVRIGAASLGWPRRGRVVHAHGTAGNIAFDPADRLEAGMIDTIATEAARIIVELAKNDHLAFTQRIYDALAGLNAAKAADLANHHTCRLGRWYDSVTDPGVRGAQAFAALDEPHRRVHAAGKLALQRLAQGDREGAGSAAADVKAASAEVVGGLDRLATELAARRR
jgi:hypothetical protein